MRKEHQKQEEDFKEMELWEHLAELRGRLIRSLCYVVLGLVTAWMIYPWLSELFFAPFKPLMEQNPNWKIVFRGFQQGFILKFQVSLVAGLVIAIPLITLEAWGFVAPGLTRNERKVFYFVIPLSVVFFFMGVACGYSVMGPSVEWFGQFIPKDIELLQDPVAYIIFMVKMVIGFGICFQLPLVLMALAYAGIVTSAGLREQWRVAVVACFVVGAVATPGGDPFSMTLMAAPLAILYIASIFLCRFVERLHDRPEKKSTAADRLRYSPTPD